MIQIDMLMPEGCSECRFETKRGFCKAMPDNFCGCTNDEGRPEWCPLEEQKPILVDTKMTDIITAMSWLEGLTWDDWPQWYSDSEVQETAKAALKVLKGLDVNCKANLA